MTINGYLELSTQLVRGYIESYAPSQYDAKLVESDRFNQYTVKDGEQVKVTVNISEVSDTSTLISFVTKGKEKVDTVVIDWTDSAWRVELPMDAVLQDLQKQFNGKLDGNIEGRVNTLMAEGGRAGDARGQRSTKPQPQPYIPLTAETSTGQRISDMPGFDDEYEILKHSDEDRPTTRPFPTVGDRDLNPPGLPKHPQMKPYIDPMGGDEEGGMYPLMNHPIFGDRRQGGNSSRLGVPPGARYDDPMGEDNLDMLGQGLPGNLGNSGSGFPGFGNPGPGPFGL